MNKNIELQFDDSLDDFEYDYLAEQLNDILTDIYQEGHCVAHMKCGQYNWLGHSGSSVFKVEEDMNCTDFLTKITEMQDNFGDCTIRLEYDPVKLTMDGTIYSHDCPMGSSRTINFMTVKEFYTDLLMRQMSLPLMDILEELYNSDYLCEEDADDMGKRLRRAPSDKVRKDIIERIVKDTETCIDESELEDLYWLGGHHDNN